MFKLPETYKEQLQKAKTGTNMIQIVEENKIWNTSRQLECANLARKL